jgi:hypothetical protein
MVRLTNLGLEIESQQPPTTRRSDFGAAFAIKGAQRMNLRPAMARKEPGPRLDH